MSWNFTAIGKPVPVLASAQKSLGAIRCAEPEETIKEMVVDLLSTALSAFPAASVVQVEAYGSQSQHGTTGISNSLKIEIKPIYGFVEDAPPQGKDAPTA